MLFCFSTPKSRVEKQKLYNSRYYDKTPNAADNTWAHIERWYCLQTAVLKEQSLGNRKMTVEYSTSVDQTPEIKKSETLFIKNLSNYKTNSGHQHNTHMYTEYFKDNFSDESALSRFDTHITLI